MLVSCPHCKQFNPTFEKLTKEDFKDQQIFFAKIDGNNYKEISEKYGVYSYPTVLFFSKEFPNYPIQYRKERQIPQMKKFISQMMESSHDEQLIKNLNKISPQEKFIHKIVAFYGRKDMPEFRIVDIAAKRDGYLRWALIDSPEARLELGNQNVVTDFSVESVEIAVQKAFAQLHGVTQQSWLKMAEKKHFTIFYINKFGNKKIKILLEKLAKELTDVHFMEIDGQHEEFKPAIKYLEITNEENIISVDKLYNAIYVADPPYTQQSLREFIVKAKAHNLTLYLKTEKTDKINKLTRDNFEKRMSTSQDVILFLYDKKQKISKELMNLFDFLVHKLSNNKNLLLLRCDVTANQIQDKLGFLAKPLPKVVFFRNRMKDYPIHFSGKTLSGASMIQFIMENTTFDFEEELAEL